MHSHIIRQHFLDFFKNKNHSIISSAPIIVKNDPTLMFTNAGMNQFKDIFLGNRNSEYLRVANSQKCLRVSGKHNDLEEVGHDTYHHTMFEMLGNWSFGNYFKKEAIEWAYEFLTAILKIDSKRLYATVFEGSQADNLEADNEAEIYWKKYLPKSRILPGSKKDNFWEMGDTGPCGPCSEIHIDLRSKTERDELDGAKLVNKDHPLVIEVWNLVFIQFNRKADGSLEPLPAKHVDTGMGFERLCMVVQNKKSSYETDLFTPLLKQISVITEIEYGSSNETDIAMRVIADHLRTLAFTIADGQIPSNNKAGYVIRRILRRAIRYGYSFLNQTEPFIYKLLPSLIDIMGDAYPELSAQKNLIEKVIREEESSFLNTLGTGIKLLDKIIEKSPSTKIDGKSTFELYDTYGFPPDLTELILKEKGYSINHREFNEEMEAQKERSRKDAKVSLSDWNIINPDTGEEFVGYDFLDTQICITRYRQVKAKGKELYHLVFDRTPFYAESGGQIGDTGIIKNGNEEIKIINTVKENDLIIQISENLPNNLNESFNAIVDRGKRVQTANNHTATHLMHDALRSILGNHVEQKGSLVHNDYLRFDFSHFQKLTESEIGKIEKIVNSKIRENLSREEDRDVELAKARSRGAISLFGEKYGDRVRTIQFGNSIELCGGTHTDRTGTIGLFKITSETAIAAGIRRIEAVTGEAAEKWVNERLNTLNNIRTLVKGSIDLEPAIEQLLKTKSQLEKQLEKAGKEKALVVKNSLKNNIKKVGNINLIASVVEVDSPALLKEISFQLKGEIESLVMILGSKIEGKAHLSVIVDETIAKTGAVNAKTVISSVSGLIQGGGGGQPFFATAGGKNPDGLTDAINEAVRIIKFQPTKD